MTEPIKGIVADVLGSELSGLLKTQAQYHDSRAEYHETRAAKAERAALVAPGEGCFYCDTAQAEHVDHFIPIARWSTAELTDVQRSEGPDHINNLVGACAACNMSKGAKLPGVEWTGRGRAA